MAVRQFFLMIWASGFFAIVNGQNGPGNYGVAGSIIDSLSKRPVAYATISVFDTANKIIAATYSLESGGFKINLLKPESYTLEISFVGYRTKQIHINISESELSKKLGNILLASGREELTQVSITARRRLVDQKPGMLVYNAENDLTNKGGTAADVLRKAPILNVDAQGNVSMRGSSNLKILINGKYSGQMARNVADALNMIPADMIRSVEIITTPSAKYDAEGAAGVINIITKKGKQDLSGTLEASVSNLEQMLNPRFSLTKQKWSISLAGHLHRLRRKSNVILDRTSFSDDMAINRLKQEIRKDNTAPHGSADLAIEYVIDESSELSLGMNTWIGKWPDGSSMNSTVLSPDGNIANQYSQRIASSSSYLGTDINLGYNRRLKKPGQQVTLLIQNSPSRDLSEYDAIQSAMNHDLLYRELNKSKTNNREWTFQADYSHPLNQKGTLHLEAGTKAIFRRVNNRYNILSSDSQQVDRLVPQPDRSDFFRYNQNVIAGYSMLKVNLKNNWYIEGGVRLEATYIKGNFVHARSAFDNNFLNLVPTATFSKKLDENNTLNLSYTKRLTRPYIWDLNPNVNASDPKNLTSGNPELQPEMAHQAELSYGLNNGQDFFMTTAIFWKQTDNAIIEFIQTDAGGISFTNKQNLAGNKQFGLNLSATTNFHPRWTMNLNTNVNYFNYRSEALDIFRRGWGSDINFSSTYRFQNELSVQAFGEYNARQVTLLGTLGQLYRYSFVGKKEIKKARITVTLAAINLFAKYIPQMDIKQRPDFISSIDTHYYNRALKLTINWEFGGTLQQKQIKKVDNDDINVQGKG